MITVERQEPRNSRIIRLVRAAARTPSRATPWTAAFTKIDWSFRNVTFRAEGRPTNRLGTMALMPSTIDKVEVSPDLKTVINTDLWPSTCTIFCWGAAPLRTVAMSPMWIVVPLTVLMGSDRAGRHRQGHL